MIHSLTGSVAGIEDGVLLLQTEGGVEWAVQVSSTTVKTLAAKSLDPQGERVRILTYLHHRDDQMALFGFATREERSVFLDLMKVGGIGTRQAMRILSGMTVTELVRALDSEDVNALSRIPGLGRKTAQKMLLTLRGKLSLEPESEPEQGDEIVDALAEMGFDRSKARIAVRSIRAEFADGASAQSLEGELLRRAIVRLSAGK